jgi:hypothetical protein
LDTSGYSPENGNDWGYLDFYEVFIDRLTYLKNWILQVNLLKMGIIGVIWIFTKYSSID